VPPGLPTLIENLKRWFPSSPPSQPQPQPDTAGPAAAAAAANESDEIYRTYREHLTVLDPDNPLLKREPVPGVSPDRSTVDRIQNEVHTVVQAKLGRFVFKDYDKYPTDKTLNGEQGNGPDVRVLKGGKTKAESDFAELSKRATPHAATSGQHAASQTILKLPGKDMYVGFRINKEGLPTIDIDSPHTGSIRFHYK